jgi:hypothetical protein
MPNPEGAGVVHHIRAGLHHLAITFDWPSWAPAVVIAALVSGSSLVNLALELVDDIDTRREQRELAVMEQRYPHCHVIRLSSGKWFLTEKTTGRECAPGNHPAEPGRALQT